MIVDDHTLVRKGFIELLKNFQNIEVTGEAENGLQLLELIRTDMPDIVITDLNMPVIDGFTLLEHLVKEAPTIKVIVLSMHHSEQLTAKLILTGAASCLHKSCDPEELFQTIRHVADYGYHFTPNVSKTIIQTTLNYSSANSVLAELGLTDREIEVLSLVCAEKTTEQIADLLGVKQVTINFHKKSIFKKTKLTSNVGLVKFAIRNGLDFD